MNIKVSIVIPHFNGYDVLKKSLEALIASSINDIEILVVDNNSSDGSVAKLRKEFPQVKIYSLKSNKGFAAASNYGAVQAQADLLLFLNNDCIVETNTIQKMHDYIEKSEEYIATQPIVLNKNGSIENIGYIVNMRLGKAEVITSINDAKRTMANQQQKNYLYGLSAACLMIKKKIFLESGMFDESFHSYLEDVDLFFRLAKKGYKYNPCFAASCLHFHMSTSLKMGTYKEKRDFFNWIRIIIKNYPREYIMENFLSLLAERLRNMSGIVKKAIFHTQRLPH